MTRRGRRCTCAPSDEGQRAGVALRRRQPELLAQARAATIGDEDGTRARMRAQPVELEQPRGDRGPERARQVVALLAPVQAIADQRPARAGEAIELDAEALEPALALVGEPVVDVVAV